MSFLLAWVSSLLLMPSGFLMSSSFDLTISLWQIESGRKVRSWLAGSNVSNSLAFDSESQLLVTANKYSDIVIWDRDMWDFNETKVMTQEDYLLANSEATGSTGSSGSQRRAEAEWPYACFFFFLFLLFLWTFNFFIEPFVNKN